MTQKRRKADSGKAIGETTALRWEPTHVTKPNPRVVPLQLPPLKTFQLHFGYTTQKVQTEALVDSGATMNFVDRVIMENNNLETYKLANLYCVINVDKHSQQGGTNN